MKVKTFLFFILFMFALSLLGAKNRPNILYLYVDDLGWGSIGPNGQYAVSYTHLTLPTKNEV